MHLTRSHIEWRALVTVLLICASDACVAQSAAAGRGGLSPTATVRAEVDSLNRAMERAFNRGDLSAVAAFYADDARLEGPRNNVVEGRTAIDAYWASVRSPKSWKLDVIEVGGSTNEVYERGRSTLVSGSASGDRTSVSEFIVIWKRGPDGRLRIARDFYHF